MKNRIHQFNKKNYSIDKLKKIQLTFLKVQLDLDKVILNNNDSGLQALVDESFNIPVVIKNEENYVVFACNKEYYQNYLFNNNKTGDFLLANKHSLKPAIWIEENMEKIPDIHYSYSRKTRNYNSFKPTNKKV